MAKKDTENALIKREIAPEVVKQLLNHYSTISAIAEASVEELMQKAELDEETAKDVVSKVAKSATRSKKTKAPVEKEEPVEIVRFEIPSVEHGYTDTERRILAISEEEGITLPLKMVVDIAERFDEAKPDCEDPATDDDLRQLVVIADSMYKAHKMDQNESAGVMAAHSIGEPGTQMNMRTFHYAGVANINVTQGLPRLIEIVDARRVPSTPSMNIPLEGIAAVDQRVAEHVSRNIEATTLLDIASIDTDLDFMRLIVRPDLRKMEERDLTIEDIADKLGKIKNVRGLVSITDDEGNTGTDAILTCIVIDSSADEPSYKKLQKIYDDVKNAKIKGIDGINRAVLSKDKDTGRYSIVTEGSNLKEVLKVDGVDKYHVSTNSILEIADVLGIEAARNSIIKEAGGTLGEAGLNVDIRHIMLVADLMTNDGSVKAIGRHGVSGKKSSVLARAAFEITTAHLLHAGMVGEVDNLEGVTENIIVGQPVTLGTGAVHLAYRPKEEDGEPVPKPKDDTPQSGPGGVVGGE